MIAKIAASPQGGIVMRQQCGTAGGGRATLLAVLLAGCTVARQPAPDAAGSTGAAGGAPARAAPASGVVEVRTAAGEVVPEAIVARSDAEILGLLHETNLAEIEAGTLAERSATNPDIKAYARRMIEDHRALDELESAGAAQLGVTPVLADSALPRQHQRTLAPLRRAGPLDFDRLYMIHQINAHRRALALIDAALIGGEREELKAVLRTDVRPRVLEHLRTADQLRQRLVMQ
jgi:putative membrane protein